jgi:hypothetical protein
MHDRYGSMAAMLAAYNAGPRRYDAHLASGRALPAETVDYVAKIAPMIDGQGPRHAPGRYRIARIMVAWTDLRRAI